MSYPKAQLILNYKEFFNQDPPKNRIDLVKNIAKTNLLTEILALNYRLKPAKQLFVDSSLETQIRELNYFTAISQALKDRCRYLYSKHIHRGYSKVKIDYPLLFTRQACLYAIEEILNTKEIVDYDEYNMSKPEIWESILRYLLSINDEITVYKQTDDEDNLLESINSKLIPLSESIVEVNLVFTPYRGLKLIYFISKHPQYLGQIESYINQKYHTSPEEFIYKLIHIYILTQGTKFEFFYYIKKEDNEIFNILSERYNTDEIHKLISIRKSPMIKIDEEKFLISDVGFLLEKAYAQLINDFWFDHIKNVKDQNNRPQYNISNYRSLIGYFFEGYVAEIFKGSFSNYKYSKMLLFDQLKVNGPNGELEIADIYLRSNNKILLGQVKSASIYDDQKYGGDLTSFYRDNRENFFRNFGVNQLVESIVNLDNFILQLDPSFPKGHSYVVYPIIIFNDKALQNALMTDIFNKRFQEILVNVDVKKIRITPLNLIHINDIERLENHLFSQPSKIWDILDYNTRDKKFIPSLFNTLNHFKVSYAFPERVRVEYMGFVKKYANEGNENTE